MFRNTEVAPDRHRRPPLRRAGLWMALAVPALAPILQAVTAVFFVSISPKDVTSGPLASSTGTVTLTAGSTVPASVALFSSNPALATVPTKGIVVTSRNRTGTFPISTVAGAAGCAIISAAVGTTAPQADILFVQPTNSPGPLTLSAGGIMSGLSLTGTVTNLSTPAVVVVTLSSSNPQVTVPPTVTLATSSSKIGVLGTFPINTAPVGSPGSCAIITATLQGSQSRALLKIFSASG